ncbi:MAG TPA: HAD family acid phosphatase [Longimicrobiales bacterium]
MSAALDHGERMRLRITRATAHVRVSVRVRLSTLAGCAILSACATAPSPAATTAAAAQPPAIHWVRSSAEHRGIFIQTYRLATERMRELAAGRPAGTWAVILDADETVLDNSEYQRRLVARGARFETGTWNAWVREEAADSLPGAAGFIRTARELGGRVAIVTNRDEDVCDPTRRNLARLGIIVDVVLCQAPGESGKNGRFEAVRGGTTGSGLPPLDVLVFIGDNIQDFPGQSQQLRGAPPAVFADFGRTWFLLPNPMYGSWERNPAH